MSDKFFKTIDITILITFEGGDVLNTKQYVEENILTSRNIQHLPNK